MKQKFTSRKFLLAAASILGSIAAAIAGFATDSQIVTIIGIVCGIVSAGIYEIVEAVIDCENAEEDTVESITENADGTTTVVYRKG